MSPSLIRKILADDVNLGYETGSPKRLDPFDDDNLKAYVSILDAKFQSVRHRSWRWFDFLWMTHTMDYEGRDNFNTITLRAFSLLGLITVISGFTLAIVTTPKLMRVFKKN